MPEWIFPYWELNQSITISVSTGAYLSEKYARTQLLVTNPSNEDAVIDLVVYEHRQGGSFALCEGGCWIMPAQSWLSYALGFESTDTLNSYKIRKVGWFKIYSNQQVMPITTIRRFEKYFTEPGNSRTAIQYSQERELSFEYKQRSLWESINNIIFNIFERFTGPRSRIYAPGTQPVPVDQSKMTDLDLKWRNPFEERTA